jgi:hypothetical protein
MKTSCFTPLLVALAFVASAQARICELANNNLQELTGGTSCSSACKCREFVPADVTIVDVKVVKVTNTGDQTISEFQLSNAGGQDTATGSLDNIDLGTYKVEVLARRKNPGNDFVDPDSTINALCVADDTNGDVLFFGQTSTFDISDTSGAAKNVKVFMQPCHAGIDYQGNDISDPPNYPPLTLQVNIDASGAVLNTQGSATVTIETYNPNGAVLYTGTGIKVKATRVGEHGGTTPDVWTVDDTFSGEGQTTTNTLTTEFQTFTPNLDSSTGRTLSTLTYQVNDAKKSYSTTAYIQPHAYKPPSFDDRLDGSLTEVTLVVAPVGDLDLEVMYFSGVRPKSATVVVGTVPSGTVTPPYPRLIAGTDATACPDYDSIIDSQYLVPGKSDATGAADQTTVFELEYSAMALYGLDRQYKIDVGSISTINTQYSTDNDCASYTVGLYQASTIALGNNAGSYSSGDWLDIPRANSAGSNNQELTAQFHLQLTTSASIQGVSTCEFTLGTTTIKTGDSSISKTSYQTFQFITAPYSKVCEAHVDGITAASQAAACPVMNQIEWGSTGGFKASNACSQSSSASAHTIELCLFTKGPDVYTTASSVQLEISRDDGSNQYIQNADSAPVVSTTGACTTLAAQAIVTDDPDARAKLVRFTFPTAVGSSDAAAFENHPICQAGNEEVNFFARIKAQPYKFDGSAVTSGDMCDDRMGFADFSNPNQDHSNIVCSNTRTEAQNAQNQTVVTCSAYRKRRNVVAAGCPERNPFVCPAANTMPFDIKVENGRLSVTMDTSFVGDKTLTIEANPVGATPRRSKFIASDFANAPSTWSVELKTKLDLVINDATLSASIKPGATVSDLTTCCSFTPAEASKLVAEMNQITQAESAQLYNPIITLSNNGNSNGDQNSGTSAAAAGGTSSSTTTTTSTSSESSGSLLVVVAVAAVLVLVAVIALAIFTVKSNKQSQRVVDLRGGEAAHQSSWQKGGAMESDF